MERLGDDEDAPNLIKTSDDVMGGAELDGAIKKVPITIVTEFGNTADIEKSLTVSHAEQQTTEWIPLANGCICCSVKDSGVAALESLVERQSEKEFDYILLETTGVADPGNIAPMFWMDEGLNSSIHLDGIVTVVDAKNILRSLDSPTQDEIPESELHDHSHINSHLLSTAHLQISHADVLILNKTDLVPASTLIDITERLTSINSLARIIPTQNSIVPDLAGTLLDLAAYSTFPSTPLTAPEQFSTKGHSHHDPSLSTLTIPLPLFDPQKLFFLENWLQSLLWDDGTPKSYEVHRTKGYIACTDGSARVVQGVREIFEIIEVATATRDKEGKEMQGKIVLIGRNLEGVPSGFRVE